MGKEIYLSKQRSASAGLNRRDGERNVFNQAEQCVVSNQIVMPFLDFFSSSFFLPLRFPALVHSYPSFLPSFPFISSISSCALKPRITRTTTRTRRVCAYTTALFGFNCCLFVDVFPCLGACVFLFSPSSILPRDF